MLFDNDGAGKSAVLLVQHIESVVNVLFHLFDSSWRKLESRRS